MSLEELLISIFRLISALPVLIYPFAGALLAVALDFSDLFLMNILDFGGIRNYQAFDKYWDLPYMTTFLVISLRLSPAYRKITWLLFGYRIVGVLLFEFFGIRWILLLFPNFFEFWVIFLAFLRHYYPYHVLQNTKILVCLFALAILKLIQEYVLHYSQFLDNYVAIDVLLQWINWATDIFR